ncbi:MAG: hypothetical protein NC131_01080 [Roseburia sp.]|nr:hypothetical protein [Roseburia sp.]
MANYKVGDLDVTISGVSKDAVSSLDEVIKQLDTLQGKLGVVSRGFNGAFNVKANNAAIRATVQGFQEIRQVTENTTDSVERFHEAIQSGAENGAQALTVESKSAEALFKRLSQLSNLNYFDTKYAGTGSMQVYKDIKSMSAELDKAREKANKYRREFVSLYDVATPQMREASAGYFEQMARGVEQAENAVTELEQKLSELRSFYGAPFNEAQAQVAKLTNEMLNLHFATGNFDDKAVQELLGLKTRINETSEAFKRLGMSEEEQVIEQYNVARATKRQQIAFLEAKIAMSDSEEAIKQYTKQLKAARKELEDLESVSKQATASKSGFSKLIGKIGRIALYRIIRRGLQMITQTFRESIQAYAQVDDSINSMMSQLTSSTKVIQLSLGTIIFPILQAITPVVQSLSVGFADMANAINKSMAKANGWATYTKITAGATKDYRKELEKTTGALFDFDKFRALSTKQDDNSIFLSTEEVSALDDGEKKYQGIYRLIDGIGKLLGGVLGIIGDIVEAVSPIINLVADIAGWILTGVGYVLEFLDNTGLIEPILYGVLTVLGFIGAAKIITWISSGAAKTAIINLAKAIKTNLTSALTKAIDLAGTAKGAFGAWGLAVAAVTAAVKILSNWDEFNKGTKIAITVISSLITALGIAFITILAVRHAFQGVAGVVTAIGLGIATLAAGVVAVRGLVDIPNYATGASDIDGGSLFVAGEAGKTEMVYTGDNGKTNVANVQQMAQATYAGTMRALQEYGVARGDMPQLREANGTRLYEVVDGEYKRRGRKTVNV